VLLVSPQRRRLGSRRGGGGGAYGDRTLMNCPIIPSGVQLIIPIVSPGRQMRVSSFATRWSWCGANIAPTHDMTTSNSASAKGSASASASRHSSSTPSESAWRRPLSSSSGVRSEATTGSPCFGRGYCGVAGSGPHIEHALPRLYLARLDELQFQAWDHLGRHDWIVAGGPHSTLPRLELLVVLRSGHCEPPLARSCCSSFHSPAYLCVLPRPGGLDFSERE